MGFVKQGQGHSQAALRQPLTALDKRMNAALIQQ